jgi:hypothetical protein
LTRFKIKLFPPWVCVLFCIRMQADGVWSSFFFDEGNIVNTFQLLLLHGNQTVDDLYRLCLAVHESTLVLAFTLEGLSPFAMHSEYVIPYAHMSQGQLQALRRACNENCGDTMTIEYGVDVYIVSIDEKIRQVDDSLMLFAATCLLTKGLSTQTLSARGYANARMDSSVLAFHTNAAVFKIVHSCYLRGGVQQESMRLVRKHNVLE